jgi:hypothetical protein
MNVEELYLGVSARITKAVVNHTTSDWPSYFEGLRDLVRRVIAETTENGLSAEDRAALLQRLMDHVTELEKNWPSLAMKS